jgi:hypothetical protein
MLIIACDLHTRCQQIGISGDLTLSHICQVCPLAVQVGSSTKALLGGSIAALLVTKWGLAMSKDEEISGPAARDFGLASQVKWVFD